MKLQLNLSRGTIGSTFPTLCCSLAEKKSLPQMLLTEYVKIYNILQYKQYVSADSGLHEPTS